MGIVQTIAALGIGAVGGWLIRSQQANSGEVGTGRSPVPHAGEYLTGKLELSPDDVAQGEDDPFVMEMEVDEGFSIMFQGKEVGALYRRDYDVDAWYSNRYLADHSVIVSPNFRGKGSKKKALEWARFPSYEAAAKGGKG